MAIGKTTKACLLGEPPFSLALASGAAAPDAVSSRYSRLGQSRREWHDNSTARAWAWIVVRGEACLGNERRRKKKRRPSGMGFFAQSTKRAAGRLEAGGLEEAHPLGSAPCLAPFALLSHVMCKENRYKKKRQQDRTKQALLSINASPPPIYHQHLLRINQCCCCQILAFHPQLTAFPTPPRTIHRAGK